MRRHTLSVRCCAVIAAMAILWAAAGAPLTSSEWRGLPDRFRLAWRLFPPRARTVFRQWFPAVDNGQQ